MPQAIVRDCKHLYRRCSRLAKAQGAGRERGNHRLIATIGPARVLVILYPRLDTLQGIARYLDSFLAHLPAGAPPVVLITGRLGPGLQAWPGVEVISIPVPANRLGLLLWSLRARRQLRALQRERGPVQAVNLHVPPLIPGLFVPHELPLTLTAPTTCLGMSGRFDAQPHFRSPWNPLSVALKRWMERRLLTQARTVVTLTEQGRQELLRHGRRDGVVTLPNGVDLARFRPVADGPPAGGAAGSAGAPRNIDVLFSGRIERRKGSGPLVDVCRRLAQRRPGVRIAIVGYGDDEERVREALRGLGPALTWVGKVPFDEVARWYHRSRVYASTSYHEGLPDTCLEAMASGLPAVVWDRLFYRGLVVDGQTGWLAPVNDVDAMVARIEALLDDPERAGAMGRLAAERVRQRHDWRVLAPRVLAALRGAQAGLPASAGLPPLPRNLLATPGLEPLSPRRRGVGERGGEPMSWRSPPLSPSPSPARGEGSNSRCGASRPAEPKPGMGGPSPLAGEGLGRGGPAPRRKGSKAPDGPQAAPLHVAWAGLRGLPGVQGGVETHAEQLCPRLVALGCRVTVLARAPYQPPVPAGRWQGVELRRLWAPRHKHLEAVLHTLVAVLYAGLVLRPDVLHLQAIGPALWTPLARLLGLRVVVTHHGPDYRRQKWGAPARAALRLGERAAAHWADELIVISRTIRDEVGGLHGRQGTWVPNGLAAPPGPAPGPQALLPFGLEPRRYVLLVSRLVPEKRHLDLIRAFARARLPGWHLALVGAADHADGYAAQVRAAAAAHDGVVCTGFQTGAALQALYAHAGLFVLPSSHEGLPIALLEALAHGLPVLASDIAPHLEMDLPGEAYFALGDIDALAERLRSAAAASAAESEADRAARRTRALQRHDWAHSATQTLQVYRRVVRRAAAQAVGATA
jgi:glycosyltransferase involved in cell wall biosynthesis